jgi:hypothetical protein
MPSGLCGHGHSVLCPVELEAAAKGGLHHRVICDADRDEVMRNAGVTLGKAQCRT